MVIQVRPDSIQWHVELGPLIFTSQEKRHHRLNHGEGYTCTGTPVVVGRTLDRAGGVSELDGLRDQPPIRIGAFNIQIFGKNKFNDPGVVPELVKVRLCGMFIQQWMHKSCFCRHRFALGTIYLWLVYKLFMMTNVLVEKIQFAYIPFWFFLYRKNIVSCIKF